MNLDDIDLDTLAMAYKPGEPLKITAKRLRKFGLGNYSVANLWQFLEQLRSAGIDIERHGRRLRREARAWAARCDIPEIAGPTREKMARRMRIKLASLRMMN